MSDAEGATTGTPWGRASELRDRKLQPGSGTPREKVARNQRERLYGAIVAVVSKKGFEATTVADVIKVCGVSRSDFYKHFANKTDCLTAAAEALIEPTLRALRSGEGEGDARAEATVERFVDLVCAEPAAARLCFVELRAAGEQGEAVADRASDGLAQVLEEVGAELSGRAPIDGALAKLLVGGIESLIQARLLRGTDAELPARASELWRWLRSVEPPPGELEAPRRQRPGGARFEGYTPAERIARAVAGVVGEKGFGATTTDDIAAQAAISLSTFYEHFADKRDAVLAALEMGGGQIMALAVPAARRAGNWQEGVRAFYEAICAYFAAEPAMAELATVGVNGAGPQALARRDRVIDQLTKMLAPGLEENPEAPAISGEAAARTIYALLRERVRSDGPESLPSVAPLATYVTLVGFVGPERALAVANRDGRRR